MAQTSSQEKDEGVGHEKELTQAEDDLSTTIAASGGGTSSNTVIAPLNADTPPDGGREAWLCVVGGVCSWFVTFGWVYSVGIFQEYYSQGPLRSYSPSEVAWISSTEIFFTFACGPIVGKLFDNYGPRGILLVGSFLHVFGVMMVSLGNQYYQFFLAQSVCSAIGVSALFFASVDTALTWFEKKAATAMGIMTAGSSIGGVVLPIMITKLIPLIGFPWTIRVVGFIFLALMILVNTAIKSHLVHKPTSINPMDFVRPLQDLTFAALCLAGAFVVLGSLLPSNFIILQAQRSGVSPDLSSYLLPVINAASFPGRIISGIVADKYGRFNVMIVVSAIATVFTFALWIPAHSAALIFVFAAISGFTSGAIFSVGPASIVQISELREIGVRNGTLFFCVAIGTLIGNPIGGALISANNGDYLYMEIFSGVILAASCAFFVISRILAVGFLKKKIF